MSVKSAVSQMSTKTKVIIGCCVAAVAAAAVILGIILGRDDTYRVLKVFEMNGNSVITREELGDLDAYVGMNLENGDTVTVGDESTLRLVLDNDKYVLLDGGTVLKLNASGNAADSRTSIELQKGTILNEIINPLSANSSYEVVTPKATMAVRGTSFVVSVTQNPDGSYIILVYTFNGKVEVTLLDSEGNPTDKKAMVGEGFSVAVITEPDSESGNPAEIDGTSRFVQIDADGVISELGSGESPVSEIIYEIIPSNIRMGAIRSHEEKLMILADDIIRKLRGESEEAVSDDKSSAESEDITDTEPAVSDEPKNEEKPVVTEVPKTEEEPIVTTVPNAVSENKTTQTGAPVNVKNTDDTPKTEPKDNANDGTKPSNQDEKTSKVTTVTSVPDVPENDSETGKTTTTTAPKTTTPNVTTVPTGPNGPTISTTTTTPTETTAPETEKYTVRFMYNGEVLYSENVESGGKVANVPIVPEREGYTGEWKIGTQIFDPNMAVTQNITVNAVYTAEKYTVTYVASFDAAKVLGTKEVEFGKKPSGFTPDTVIDSNGDGAYDYYLWGWDAGSLPTVTSDTTITVPYVPYNEIHEVRVTDNGTALIHKLYRNGDAIILPTPTSTAREGYEFKGWGKVGSGDVFNTGLKEGSGRTYEPSNPEELLWYGEEASGNEITLNAYNIMYMAVYKPIQFTVKFNAEDADTPYSNEMTVDYGTAISSLTLPAVPAKTGYTGIWTYNGVELDPTMTITSATTFTAKYTPETYTVSYVASFDTTRVIATEDVEYGETPSGFDVTDAVTAIDSNNDGSYDYYIWDLEDTFAGLTAVTADKTVEVTYVPYNEVYEVMVTDNGNKLVHELYRNGDTITLPTPTSTAPEGYEFKGWGHVGSGGEDTFGTGLKVGTSTYGDPTDADDVRFYYNTGYTVNLSYRNFSFISVYEPIQLTISLTAVDADIPYTNEITVDYGKKFSELTLPDVPEKAGYTGQWTIGGVPIDPNTVIKENVTLTAVYN